MRRLHILIVAAAVVAAVASTAATAARPLRTAVSYTGVEGGPVKDLNLAFGRIRASGASAFRATLYWWSIAPVERPARFSPRDHREPA